MCDFQRGIWTLIIHDGPGLECLLKLIGCAIPFYRHILLIHHLEKVPIPDEEQSADVSFHLGVQKESVSFVHRIGWNQALISQTFA